MSGKRSLIYGIGVNDANYLVASRMDGKVVKCPFYQVWTDMLMRCYSKKYQQRQPTYVGCYVCSEWFAFSNFKAWMEEQDWKGKQLDKDILLQGNKMYSPDMCVFVAGSVNKLLTDRANSRGQWMIGVCWHKQHNKFIAKCNDGNGRRVHLGLFTSELEAHLAWKAYKHRLACKLAGEQSDMRVAEALRKRYSEMALTH